jgi:carboxyl-terminal processing protease
MKNRIRSLSLIGFGVLFGLLVSLNFSVFADKNADPKNLPI